ncbi:MAG: hypothetical protein ACXWT3_08925 [Methylococcaceae bacterium]
MSKPPTIKPRRLVYGGLPDGGETCAASLWANDSSLRSAGGKGDFEQASRETTSWSLITRKLCACH